MAQKLKGAQEGLRKSTAYVSGETLAPEERRRLEDLVWTSPKKGSGITWSRTIRKEARGFDDLHLGRVQAVESQYVRAVKGFIRKETFLIPRDLAEGFDGSTLWFGIEPGREHEFRRKDPQTEDELEQ